MVVTSTATSPRQHALRTYIVLNAKSSRGRLASLTDILDDTMNSASGKDIPDECIAYESYAAVASRHQPSSPQRQLRWSDLNRPRLHLATVLSQSTGKHLSQKARKRQWRRARSSSGNPNEHLEFQVLELCFEFLDLPDLQRARAVCAEFRDVIIGSSHLLVGLYGRKWHPTSRHYMMARAYYQLSHSEALSMYQKRLTPVINPLSTSSQVTKLSDSTFEILNNSLLRSFTTGAVDSVRGTNPLPVLPCAEALNKRVSYFEVSMKGCGSVGIISLSDTATRKGYGLGSDAHVGWSGISYGYHGNDGDFVYNDGTAPYGGEWKPFGPSWGGLSAQSDNDASVYTVGCGLNMDKNEVFFTLNGRFVGVAPVSVVEGEYTSAISLHEFNDVAILNAGSTSYKFDIEGYCASP